jgi:hypothetical protein
MSTAPNSDFWQRVGLNEGDRVRCLQLVQERYSECQVEEFTEQGYCSFTFLVCPTDSIAGASNHHNEPAHGALQEHDEEASLIVQIRPPRHALDIGIGRAAKQTYPSLAPVIQVLHFNLPGRLCAYEMQKMRGVPLSRLLPRTRNVDPILRTKQERLIDSFASLIARTWSSSSTPPMNRNIRADSPMEQDPKILLDCTGKVGSSILHRLEKLGNELPDPRLRHIAKTTLASYQAMHPLPIVLNHGDLIPSNILVDKETWAITGLVDWAEAENLPLGTCLYGLEHVLGFIRSVSHEVAQGDGSTLDAPVFVYHDHASYLRDLFWSRVCVFVTEVETRLEDVRVTRDMGVLLWYGYAWDDGAIDRVVNEADDAVEVVCLRSFLNVM